MRSLVLTFVAGLVLVNAAEARDLKGCRVMLVMNSTGGSGGQYGLPFYFERDGRVGVATGSQPVFTRGLGRPTVTMQDGGTTWTDRIDRNGETYSWVRVTTIKNPQHFQVPRNVTGASFTVYGDQCRIDDHSDRYSKPAGCYIECAD